MLTEHRIAVVAGRLENYYDIMKTTIFAFIAIAAIYAIGGGSFTIALVALVIITVAYGILAGGTALEDVDKLRDDMDEEAANSHYGVVVRARNMGALKTTSNGLIAVVGLIEIIAMLTGM